MSETKKFRLSEITSHNTNKTTWIVIHNNVYDVTEFLNEHPGGEEVLLEQGGKEATEQFEDVGHSTDAREMMKKFKIGELVEEEQKKLPEKQQPDWGSANETVEEDSSIKQWLLPLLLGILATIIYRYFFV